MWFFPYGSANRHDGRFPRKQATKCHQCRNPTLSNIVKDGLLKTISIFFACKTATNGSDRGDDALANRRPKVVSSGITPSLNLRKFGSLKSLFIFRAYNS